MVFIHIVDKNEEKNIERCICSAKQIASRILVVDSGSTDKTLDLVKKCGAETMFHEWPGHAKQFNWILDNCNINTEWVFRLDADERISERLAKEILAKLVDRTSHNVDGYEMRWRIYFMNKWIRHGGTHKPYFLRLFRYGKGRVEEKLMDEHIVVQGKVEKMENDLIHYDYKGLDAWLNKHIWYSQLEFDMYKSQQNMQDGNLVQKKKRVIYYRLPIFIRVKLYCWYRYFIQVGFLDGKEGKIFCFLQAYWYRFLVDAKIYEQSKENSTLR